MPRLDSSCDIVYLEIYDDVTTPGATTMATGQRNNAKFIVFEGYTEL